jgi:hypothetical protein
MKIINLISREDCRQAVAEVRNMTKINNTEHFKAALRFAKTLPKESRRSLRHCFSVLNRIKRNSKREIGHAVEVRLFPDWVKHSWAFNFFCPATNQQWFHGGLILHGFEETFSVELNPSHAPHWSIHT